MWEHGKSLHLFRSSLIPFISNFSFFFFFSFSYIGLVGFPDGSEVKNPPTMWEIWIRSLSWEDPWRRKWQPTPVFLPGEFHGYRSLVGPSPWCRRVRHNWVTKHIHTYRSCTYFLRFISKHFFLPSFLFFPNVNGIY